MLIVDIALIVCFGALYVYNLSPGLPWLDSGELVAAAHSLGFSHPPTHPFYSLLGHALSYILPGNIAYRYNAVSLLLALATLVVMRHLVSAVLKGQMPNSSEKSRKIIAAFVTVMLGLNSFYYIQALRAEVYTLEFLVIALVTYLLVKPTGDLKRRCYAAALLMGLGVAVHPIRIGMFGPFVVLLLWGKLSRKEWLKSFGYFCLGLLPYFYHVLRDYTGVSMAWGHFRTLGDWRMIISGSAAGQNVTLPSGAQMLQDLSGLFKLTFERCSGLLLLCGLFGGYLAIKRQWRLAAATGLILCITLPVILVRMGVGYGAGNLDNPDNGASMVLPVMLLLLLAAITLQRFVKSFKGPYGKWWGLGAVTVGGVLVFVQLLQLCEYGGLRHSYYAERFINRIEQALPEKAVLFTSSDFISIPFVYVQRCEQRRSDVTMLVPLEVTDQAKYADRSRVDPQGFPSLESLRQIPLQPPILLKLMQSGTPHYLERVLQYYRNVRPIYFDPRVLSLFTMDVKAVKRDGLLLAYKHAAARPTHADALLPENQELLMATSQLDRFANVSFMKQLWSSLADYAYRSGEPLQALEFIQAALRYHPSDTVLLNNKRVLEGR